MASAQQPGSPSGAARRPAETGVGDGVDGQSDNAVTLPANGEGAATPAATGESTPNNGDRTQKRIQKLLDEKRALERKVAELQGTTQMTDSDDDDIPATPAAELPREVLKIMARDRVQEALPHLNRAQASKVADLSDEWGGKVPLDLVAKAVAEKHPDLFPAASQESGPRPSAVSFIPQAPSSGPRQSQRGEYEEKRAAASKALATNAPGTEGWLRAMAAVQKCDAILAKI